MARPRSSWSAAVFTSDRAGFGDVGRLALDALDPWRRATVQSTAAAYALIDGDGHELRRQGAALLETSAGGQNQVAERASLLLAQTIATLDGRLDRAEELSVEGAELRRRTGLPEADKVRAIEQLAIGRERGRLGEVTALFSTGAVGRPLSSSTEAALAFTAAESGRWDEAAALLALAGRQRFTDIPDDADWPVALALWSEVAAQVGDAEAAGRLHELLEPMDGLTLGAEGIACGPASRLLAILEYVLGRPADADGHFVAAIECSRHLASPVWVARCQLDWAETWIGRGHGQRAAELIGEVEDIVGPLTLPALQSRAAELRDRLSATGA
jgi:hypothetical protein